MGSSVLAEWRLRFSEVSPVSVTVNVNVLNEDGSGRLVCVFFNLCPSMCLMIEMEPVE